MLSSWSSKAFLLLPKDSVDPKAFFSSKEFYGLELPKSFCDGQGPFVLIEELNGLQSLLCFQISLWTFLWRSKAFFLTSKERLWTWVFYGLELPKAFCDCQRNLWTWTFKVSLCLSKTSVDSKAFFFLPKNSMDFNFQSLFVTVKARQSLFVLFKELNGLQSLLSMCDGYSFRDIFKQSILGEKKGNFNTGITRPKIKRINLISFVKCFAHSRFSKKNHFFYLLISNSFI